MLYWLFKWFAVAPALRLVCRPWVEGAENLPDEGPAILASNHLSAGDTVLLPAMIGRRVTFPAKAELFHGRGFRGRLTTLFLKSIGQKSMDRSGGRASATSMDGVLEVLEEGHLLGIYPEGTRSPDGRLYKGKTGTARLVLRSGVPVIPVAMFATQAVRSRFFGFPIMRRPGIRIGKPLDFTRYASAGSDRDVLRWVTDEIMNAIMELSGQEYVDAYAISVKTARAEGRELVAATAPRPGFGRPVPPVPVTLSSGSSR
ncbi:lysophospholipid acyltransferase family protein [Microlunatus panaciterrae]|uniref:1-acyl-sn-glycerol-3-phosphate acyltransferase n=1 Tax=Microlunatus panaciterrae TaxID=400768 RepID=A0ABS2RQG0_9ACTN|nr:lysophospholipid acyltransferase family protein [Microlunatus panaciterrae]MBM7800164.1 1-acyl-sn-glycerol-3-phosphate acyltransferase [Microlunatus panaciterrae]